MKRSSDDAGGDRQGAASGIGRATVERLVANDASVVAVDRSADTLAWTGSTNRGHIHAVIGDVTEHDVNAASVTAAVEHFGRLDAAVFNAGVSMGGDLLDLPMEEFDRSIAVNVRAVALGIRAVVPTLRANGAGRIVVTASTSGMRRPQHVGLQHGQGCGRQPGAVRPVDLGPDGITVNTVCPGPTETAMTERLRTLDAYEELRRRIPLQRWGRAEEIAAVIDFLTSADASFVNGAVVPVDGGITASTGQFLPPSARPEQIVGAHDHHPPRPVRPLRPRGRRDGFRPGDWSGHRLGTRRRRL